MPLDGLVDFHGNESDEEAPTNFFDRPRACNLEALDTIPDSEDSEGADDETSDEEHEESEVVSRESIQNTNHVMGSRRPVDAHVVEREPGPANTPDEDTLIQEKEEELKKIMDQMRAAPVSVYYGDTLDYTSPLVTIVDELYTLYRHDIVKKKKLTKDVVELIKDLQDNSSNLITFMTNQSQDFINDYIKEIEWLHEPAKNTVEGAKAVEEVIAKIQENDIISADNIISLKEIFDLAGYRENFSLPVWKLIETCLCRLSTDGDASSTWKKFKEVLQWAHVYRIVKNSRTCSKGTFQKADLLIVLYAIGQRNATEKTANECHKNAKEAYQHYKSSEGSINLDLTTVIGNTGIFRVNEGLSNEEKARLFVDNDESSSEAEAPRSRNAPARASAVLESNERTGSQVSNAGASQRSAGPRPVHQRRLTERTVFELSKERSIHYGHTVKIASNIENARYRLPVSFNGLTRHESGAVICTAARFIYAQINQSLRDSEGGLVGVNNIKFWPALHPGMPNHFIVCHPEAYYLVMTILCKPDSPVPYLRAIPICSFSLDGEDDVQICSRFTPDVVVVITHHPAEFSQTQDRVKMFAIRTGSEQRPHNNFATPGQLRLENAETREGVKNGKIPIELKIRAKGVYTAVAYFLDDREPNEAVAKAWEKVPKEADTAWTGFEMDIDVPKLPWFKMPMPSNHWQLALMGGEWTAQAVAEVSTFTKGSKEARKSIVQAIEAEFALTAVMSHEAMAGGIEKESSSDFIRVKKKDYSKALREAISAKAHLIPYRHDNDGLEDEEDDALNETQLNRTSSSQATVSDGNGVGYQFPLPQVMLKKAVEIQEYRLESKQRRLAALNLAPMPRRLATQDWASSGESAFEPLPIEQSQRSNLGRAVMGAARLATPVGSSSPTRGAPMDEPCSQPSPSKRMRTISPTSMDRNREAITTGTHTPTLPRMLPSEPASSSPVRAPASSSRQPWTIQRNRGSQRDQEARRRLMGE